MKKKLIIGFVVLIVGSVLLLYLNIDVPGGIGDIRPDANVWQQDTLLEDCKETDYIYVEESGQAFPIYIGESGTAFIYKIDKVCGLGC